MLRTDKSYFETKVKIDNRTNTEHPFMWFENAGIHVNSEYQLFFPQDVKHVHHHYDRHHATFPLHKGWYAVENHEETTDISIHKNTIKGNSYFAGPSKYDFFGGYDHLKKCGVVHVGDHHMIPGKKMFQWALEDLGDAWNANLTDNDGEHAELMAGAYADDQPDFTWIKPYEIKYFNQYWYPIHGIKVPTIATIDAAVSVDREENKVRVITTSIIEDARLLVMQGEKIILDRKINLEPSECLEFDVNFCPEKFYVELTKQDETKLIAYTEDISEIIDIPKDNLGIPTPHTLNSAQDIYIAGRHIEQYRDPSWSSEEYYKVALERDPDYIPALIGMAYYCYNHSFYENGLTYLRKVEKQMNAYNHNPSDGTYSYLKGLCEYGLHETWNAYESLFKACWSNNSISWAMPLISAIDGQNGEYNKMKEHAISALRKEEEHAIAGTYAAIADWKLGDVEAAKNRLKEIVKKDKLNHLANYARVFICGDDPKAFYGLLSSNPSQTCIDISIDLSDAGQYQESIQLFEGLKKYYEISTMALYMLAWLYDKIGDANNASKNRQLARPKKIVDTFPYRLPEIDVLRAAVNANAEDATATYLLGCILYDKKHYAEAARCWENAIKADLTFYIPYRNLAIAYYSKMNRREEALELLLKANTLNPCNDILVKETNYVMAHLGYDSKRRLEFILSNKPAKVSDNLTWDLAYAYGYNLEFDKALSTLAEHEFVAAECCETYLTEIYTWSCCSKGRMYEKSGNLQLALEYYQKAQLIPSNFRAGWWDTQALYYARYFEARVLISLGKKDAALEIIHTIESFVRSRYSPYMGPEVEYYIAAAYKLEGDEITAIKYLSKAVICWEKELLDPEDCRLIQTALYISYTDDPTLIRKGALYFALGYSRLFFGDKDGAKKYFEKSLKYDPENMKVTFELEMLL